MIKIIGMQVLRINCFVFKNLNIRELNSNIIQA